MTVTASRLEAWGTLITNQRLARFWAFLAPIISIVSPRIFILYLAAHAAGLAIPLWLAIYRPQGRFSAAQLPDRLQIVFWMKWLAAFAFLFLIANINSADHSDTLTSTLHVFTALFAIAIFSCGIRVIEFEKLQSNFRALLWGVIAAWVIFNLVGLTYNFQDLFPESIQPVLTPLSGFFNRSLVVATLLTGLAIWHAVLTGQKGLAWIASGLMSSAILFSQSESALLAAIVLLVVTIFVRRWGETVIRILGALALVWIWVLPLVINYILEIVAGNTWIRETGQYIQAIYSALARLEIWAAASDRIAERPFLGWGHDGVQHYGLPTIQGIFFPIKTPLHPHNGALQAWIDLGILGPIALSVAIILLCRYLINTKGWTRPFMTAIAFATIGAMFVSHGLWQTWWIGLLGYLFGTCLVMEDAGRRLSPDANITNTK